MKKILLYLILIQGMCFAQSSSPLLVQWDMNLAWGGYTPAISYFDNAGNSLSASNITVSNSVSMGIDSDGFLSTGWSNNTNTPDFTKYYQFAVTPQQGQNLLPALFRFQQNGNCKKFHVRYSTDASFPNNGTLLLSENNAHNNQNEYFDIPFPEGVMVASGQTLYIRIYGYHIQNGNAWRIKSFWNSAWNLFGINDAPQLYGTVSNSLVAVNDTATAVQGYPASIDVTANDIAAGTSITGMSIVSQPLNGTAAVQQGNTISFTPAQNYLGITTFVYKITATNGSFSTATVTVNVTPMMACTANEDNVALLKNSAAEVNVLANDVAGSGPITTVAIAAAASHGTATVNGNTIAYIPEYNYTGSDSIVYSITDTYNNTAQAVVSITVSAPVLPSPDENTGIYCSSSTTWNGTAWSNGVPTADKDAVIAADYTQNGSDLTACSLFVTDTAQVVFENNSNAFITHNVVVHETASLTFESSCNLIQSGNNPNEGNVTIKRLGSNLKRLDYSFWTSPVTGDQTLQEFSPQTLPNRFYTYNTQTNDFLGMAAGGTFETARSYLIRMPDVIFGPQAEAYAAGNYRFPFEGVFTGTPNNGDITMPMQYYDAVNSINSVGNPYPSPISITAFIDENLDNIEGTLWIWRKTNNADETSYCTVTKFGYIANNAPGGGGASGDDGNTLIADPFTIDDDGVLNTGQGFLVKARNNGNLVFKNSMRKSSNYENFFRNGSAQQTPPSGNAVTSKIWLNITNSESSVFSQTLIGYTEGATTGYDNGLDAHSSLSGAVSLYSVIDDAQLAIQARPAFTVSDVVKIGYKATTAGTYKILIDHFNGVFVGDQSVYLKDNETGVVHDIKNAEYVFSTEAGIFDERFELIYLSETELSQPEIKAVNVKVFSEGKKVIIHAGEEIRSVAVHDVLGRMLYTNDKIMDATFTSPDVIQNEQMIIVRILLNSGVEFTQKIIPRL